MLAGDPCLQSIGLPTLLGFSLVNPALCLVLKQHRGHPPQTFPWERSPWRGLPCPPSGGSHHPVPSDSLFLFPALSSLLLHLTHSGTLSFTYVFTWLQSPRRIEAL